MTVAFVDFACASGDQRIEFEWVGQGSQTMVFLHEGLGSLAMWKTFPRELCASLGCRGLVYSRPGYGQSSGPDEEEAWGNRFMHEQSLEVLPALLQTLGVVDRVWLFGHSDGGSISLLYAAHFPQRVAGLVVMAPHIMVEPISIESIKKAREAYASTDLPERLARYHDDPQRAFRRWNDVWLSAPFKDWSITFELTNITCPLLAIQGIDDEYGTLGQIRGIKRHVPQTELLELAACGHSPHRDQPARVIEAITAFFKKH